MDAVPDGTLQGSGRPAGLAGQAEAVTGRSDPGPARWRSSAGWILLERRARPRIRLDEIALRQRVAGHRQGTRLVVVGRHREPKTTVILWRRPWPLSWVHRAERRCSREARAAGVHVRGMEVRDVVPFLRAGALMAISNHTRPSRDAGSPGFDDSEAAFRRRLQDSLSRARRLPANVLAVIFKDEPTGALSGGHDWNPDDAPVVSDRRASANKR